MEGRNVAVIYIPGAYPNALMDEYVLMVLEGRLADILVKVAPNIYQKYLGVGKNNQPVLYVRLHKALY
eukprot:4231933-Ditylum_brightwellii.AAC.1